MVVAAGAEEVSSVRDPEYTDLKWMYEAYQDWPAHDDHGAITEQLVNNWLRRWKIRGDIKCRVMDEKGFITYRLGFGCCEVRNIVVHPKYRGQGVGLSIIRALREELMKQGVMVAEFDTLPGVIRNQLGNAYQDLGNGRGRLVWDMAI